MYIQKKFQLNSLSEKKRSNKKRIVLNTVALLTLVILFFAAGVTLGLLTAFYIPQIQISNNEGNEFKFLSRNNKVIIGGRLQIFLEIKNQSVLSSKLFSENIQYFYYPIGKTYNCLLYNGGLLSSPTDTSTLEYKSEIATPSSNNEDFFSTSLSVNLNYTLFDEESVHISVPLSLGYEVTEKLKEEVQPLYNDCKNFQKIYFSIRFNNIRVTNTLRTVTHNNFYEFVFHSKCFIDKNVDTFFNAKPKNKKIILEGLINNPTLLE